MEAATWQAAAPARRNAKAKVTMGADARKAATTKGNGTRGRDARKAAALAATKAARKSDYNKGGRTPAQKANLLEAGALPWFFMPAHKVLLSPHPN